MMPNEVAAHGIANSIIQIIASEIFITIDKSIVCRVLVNDQAYLSRLKII